MSNLRGFWHPGGRGPKRSSLNKPAKTKPPREKKKKYTKIKITLVTRQECGTNSVTEILTRKCTAAELADFLAAQYPEDAKAMLNSSGFMGLRMREKT